MGHALRRFVLSLFAVCALLTALLLPVTTASAAETCIQPNQACTSWDPTSGPPGTKVTIKGKNWPSSYTGKSSEITWGYASNNTVATITVSGDGTFNADIIVPANAPVGKTSIDVNGDFTLGRNLSFEVTTPSGADPGPRFALSLPSNLRVTGVDPTTVRMTWTDNSRNESGFQVNDGVTTRTVGANTTTYDFGGREPGSWSCYRVRAYNATGASSWEPPDIPINRCTWTPKPKSPAPDLTPSKEKSSSAKRRGTPRPASCKPVHLVGVRGSGRNTEGGFSDNLLAGVLGELQSKSERASDVEDVYVNYPALSVPSVPPRSVTDVGAWWPYLNGVHKGVSALREHLGEQAEACPTQRVVLVGYSQGAWVVTAGIKSGALSKAAQERIVAAVLLGDPVFDPTAKGYTAGSFDPAKAGVVRRIPRTTPGDAGINALWQAVRVALPPVPDPYLPGYLDGKVRSYCLKDDPVCNPPSLPPAGCTDDSCPHLRYTTDGYTKTAGDSLAARVQSG